MRTQLQTFIFLIALPFFINGTAVSQSKFLTHYSISQSTNQISPLLPSNSISHVVTSGSTLWIGTSKGLARSPDGGRTWESFAQVPQFANPGIFAIALRGDTIWTSTGYNKNVNGQDVQTGSGYTYSLDNGSLWSAVPQTLDALNDSLVRYGNNTVRFLPIVVNEQNVTFDIALTDSLVWIASWSSGLRKSSDRGKTWNRVVLPSIDRNTISPGDSLGYYYVDPRPETSRNFLVFSVFAENDSVIWTGTAGGVNKSTDRGNSWVKFTAQNQVAHILGNWVIAINAQRIRGKTRLWTTNWQADSPDEQYGVSYTDDGGRIWKNFLPGVKSYGFAFKDSVAYVATDSGLFRTDDDGRSWSRSGTIIDQSTRAQVISSAFFAVGVIGDTVYGGTGDGLVKTLDNATHPFGQTWDVMRAYRPVAGTSVTYAYPNPFPLNPFASRTDATRIHYATVGQSSSVTVEIFDFGMNRIRTIIKDAQRSGPAEHDELWNGRTDSNSPVPNGVYFYRVIINGGDPAWGKVMVLQ